MPDIYNTDTRLFISYNSIINICRCLPVLTRLLVHRLIQLQCILSNVNNGPKSLSTKYVDGLVKQSKAWYIRTSPIINIGEYKSRPISKLNKLIPPPLLSGVELTSPTIFGSFWISSQLIREETQIYAFLYREKDISLIVSLIVRPWTSPGRFTVKLFFHRVRQSNRFWCRREIIAIDKSLQAGLSCNLEVRKGEGQSPILSMRWAVTIFF